MKNAKTAVRHKGTNYEGSYVMPARSTNKQSAAWVHPSELWCLLWYYVRDTKTYSVLPLIVDCIKSHPDETNETTQNEYYRK